MTFFISLAGHIKNQHGSFTQTNTYVQKLEKCMSENNWDYEYHEESKEYNRNAGTLTLRIGNDIYENCILDELKATIATEEKKGALYYLKINYHHRYSYYSRIPILMIIKDQIGYRIRLQQLSSSCFIITAYLLICNKNINISLTC